MTASKRRKNTRQRGSKTHGWGSMKKHRGAGNRGGRGMAGTGKRSDTKKPSIWHNKKYFGKHGFIHQNVKEKINPTNILFLEEQHDKIGTEIDLEKLGYNKLLSKGKVTQKYKITVKYASQKAIEKIKEKGGEIILKSTKPETENNKKDKKQE